MAAYHITHIENLQDIATAGELLSDTETERAGIEPVSIAYADLKERRAGTLVGCAAGGTLADYVPFYYAPRSPMLYVNFKQGVEGYSGGQEGIAHLVCSIEDLAVNGDYIITDGHAAGALTSQFDTLDRLDQVDWGVMGGRYWSDTDEDGDRKRRRQAEFLVHGRVSFDAIRLIGVMNRDAADRVEEALAGIADPPPIRVRTDWYY